MADLVVATGAASAIIVVTDSEQEADSLAAFGMLRRDFLDLFSKGPGNFLPPITPVTCHNEL